MIDDNGVEWVRKDVMLERLSSKQAQISELQTKAKELSEQVADTEKTAKRLERLKAERDDLSAKLESTTSDYQRKLTLMEHGVSDPEMQDIVLYRYGKLEGDDRPELSDYLAGPAREDRVLASLWQSQASDAAESGSADEAAPEPDSAPSRTPHRPNAGVRPAPPPAPPRDQLRDLGRTPARDILAQHDGDREAALRAIEAMD